MVLETTWPNLTVTDYLDCLGRPSRPAGGSQRPGPGPRRSRTGPASSSPLASTSAGPAPAWPSGTTASRSSDTADLMVLRAPGVEWELDDDGRHQTAAGRRRPARRAAACSSSAAARPAPGRLPHRGERPRTTPTSSGRAGPTALHAARRSRPRSSAAAPSSLKGAVPRPDRRHPGRRHDQPARVPRRHPQLGLPLLLAARRRPVSVAPSCASAATSEAMAYLDWVLRHPRAARRPRAPAPAVPGHRPPPAAGGRHRRAVGLRRQPPGPRRQRRRAPGPARRVRPGRRPHLAAAPPRAPRCPASTGSSSRPWCGAVEKRWHEPDHGIWEVRALAPPPRALQGHVLGHGRPGHPGRRATSSTATTTTGSSCGTGSATTCSQRGWKDEVGSFTAAYDGTDLDASVLAIGLYGLVDPRRRPLPAHRRRGRARAARRAPPSTATAATTACPAREGGFHLMTSWLVDAYLATGREDDARELFAGLVDLRRPDRPAVRGVRPRRPTAHWATTRRPTPTSG